MSSRLRDDDQLRSFGWRARELRCNLQQVGRTCPKLTHCAFGKAAILFSKHVRDGKVSTSVEHRLTLALHFVG